nr:alkaline ceramidase [Alsobacter ponti]
MAGFVARPGPATGTHDRLTARALAVGDTALAVVDVVALDPQTSARIRARARLPAERIVIAALHNHGGPVSTVQGLGGGPDAAWLAAMEDACVAALDAALAAQRPARLLFAEGADPGVARNRREPGGPVDPALPVLAFVGLDGAPIAHLVSYACHPVVLGADNTLWTADYPHFVRAEIERRNPGTVALFATGCAGELNTGHTAHGSITTAANPLRTFAEAERIGRRIAECASVAMRPLDATGVDALDASVTLDFARNEPAPPAEMAARWRAELAGAEPARRLLLESWIAWAEGPALLPLEPHAARVGALRWGPALIASLPGEIFAETGVALRRDLEAGGAGPSIVLAYADECLGYVPPASQYAKGGYEVAEAHRYYGARAAYAPGSAERLADAARGLAARLRGAA